MGSNKEWATEQLTSGNYTFSDDWPTYTATHSEMVTVNAFDHNTPDMFDVYDYVNLKTKYPALKQAWEHYQNVLKLCRAKEAEEKNED